MARVAIVHRSFGTIGGAESVCMNTIDALADDHDIELVTAVAHKDYEFVNAFFGTEATDFRVNEISVFGRSPDELLHPLERRLEGTPLGYLGALRQAIFHRLARREAQRGDVDLVMATTGPFTSPSVTCLEYINYPLYFNRSALPDLAADNPNRRPRNLRIFRWIDKAAGIVAGYDPAVSTPHTVFTNSNWTADLLSHIYGWRPSVLYPPVRTSEFRETPTWNNRSDDFIIAGRIAPDKRILEVVEIIENVRGRGHDVGLTVTGPLDDVAYANRVQQEIDECDFVTYAGSPSRPGYVELLKSHRYGIHEKAIEHFGMGIAEMVAARVLPFVPDDGGQTEIVNEIPELLYSDMEDAVDKIDTLLSSPSDLPALRSRLPDIESSFGQERFQYQIRDVVSTNL